MLGDKNRINPRHQKSLGHKVIEKEANPNRYEKVGKDYAIDAETIRVCLECKRTRCTGDCKEHDQVRKNAPKKSAGPVPQLHEWNGKMYTARELGQMAGLSKQYVRTLIRKGLSIDEIMDPNRPKWQRWETRKNGKG